MIVFNEGLPGAGKSYDAVSAHILPALKAGRHVYARLNGLSHYAIALHLGMPEDKIRELLHLVSSEEVLKLFIITKPKNELGEEIWDGDMELPHLRRDSLIVIDEAHEFYVSSREELPTDRENFFAKHRHFGLDILLISQWFKRMHSAVRGRVERKHLFRKLGFIKALRSKRAGDKYVCRQQICMEPDKFAVLSSEERTYDPAIFLLYHGIQPGTGNAAAYDPGFQGLFSRKQKILFVGVVVIVLLAGGRSYTGYKEMTEPKGGTKKQSLAPTKKRAEVRPGTKTTYSQANTKPGTKQDLVPVPEKPPLPPTVQYVIDLGKTARPRLAGVFQGNVVKYGIIQWHSGRSHIIDSLDTRELEKMGWSVTFYEGWLQLRANDQVIIVTAWPLEDTLSVSRKQIRESAGL